MTNDFSIFQPLGSQDAPTAVLISRCLNDAFQHGHTALFIPIINGYKVDGKIFTDADLTIIRVVQWEAYGEKVIFKYLTSGGILGYTLKRIPATCNDSSSNNQQDTSFCNVPDKKILNK